MTSSRFTKKVYNTCYEDDKVFVFHLEMKARMAGQYFVELHKKRARNLGIYDFDLPFIVSEDGKLTVQQSDFRKLESLFLRNITEKPSSVYDVMRRRADLFEILKGEFASSDRGLRDGRYWESDPRAVFNAGTDFSSFYLEYYFPYGFFEDRLTGRLNYSKEESENIVQSLISPTPSAHLEYNKRLLQLAAQKLMGEPTDLAKFRMEFGFLDNQDIKVDRLSTYNEVDAYIDQSIIRGRNKEEILSEMRSLDEVAKNVSRSYSLIKKEIMERCSHYGMNSELMASLADLLIDTGIDNEENHYWRNRIFAHLRDASIALGLDYKTSTIEELDEAIRKSKLQAIGQSSSQNPSPR